MTQNMAPTPIIQNSIPVRYDSRVVVKPCEPSRVPYLPLDVLYQIAKALPQPKQVFNLALASRDVWEYLQPALYECEVTYETRLAHKFGGRSTASVDKYYSSWLEERQRVNDISDDGFSDDGFSDHWHGFSDGGFSDDDFSDDESYSGNGVLEDEDAERAVRAERKWSAELSYQDFERMSMRICITDPCDTCIGRIDLENRIFKAQMPKARQQFRIVGSMTALHWASIHGASALAVAQKAIRAALAHQPSYINGLGLIERCYGLCKGGPSNFRQIFADHPPPLFLALAHGNSALCEALINAGADVSLLLGRTVHRDNRGALMCSKIHWQCFEPPNEVWEPRCLFDQQIDSNADENDGVGDDFIHCQTIGHIAVQFGHTEMLQMLLRNGLDAQQGSCHLLHYAVLHGNLAAVKVILAHDPSAAHLNRYRGNTPMHLVPFMKGKAGVGVSEGQLESIVSCLLEHGASLEAPAERYELGGYYSFEHDTPLDSAIQCLEDSRFRWGDERKIITALRAANVLINKGSSWLPPPSGHDGILPFNNDLRGRILNICTEKTVLLVENMYFGDVDLWNPKFDSIRYRAVRKAWGQLCRSLIGKASEVLSRGADSDKVAVQEMLQSAFRRLVDRTDDRFQQQGIVGWWALEAVGHLFRSTGMRPCSKTLWAWKRILERDYEAQDRKIKSIKACEEIDGGESEWEVLLEGITFAEAAFFPGRHYHRED